MASGRQRLPKGGELLAGWPAAGQGKVRGPPPDPGTRARAARSSSHNRDHPPHRSSSTPIGHFMAGLTNDDVLSTSRQASWSRGRWGVAQSVRQRAARLASGQGLEVWVGGRGRGEGGGTSPLASIFMRSQRFPAANGASDPFIFTLTASSFHSSLPHSLPPSPVLTH